MTQRAVAFLKQAFGASETYRLMMSNGKIAHCELRLGDSIFNLGTSMEGWPAHGLVAQIYVEDSDALVERAVQAGATVIMPMTDIFFGSREGRVGDPFGNVWTIATLKEEVALEEMQRRMNAEGYQASSSGRPIHTHSCSADIGESGVPAATLIPIRSRTRTNGY